MFFVSEADLSFFKEVERLNSRILENWSFYQKQALVLVFTKKKMWMFGRICRKNVALT